MPKRRGLRGGLHEAFSSASDVFSTLMQQRIQNDQLERRQAAEDKRWEAAQQAALKKQLGLLVMEGKIAPAQAAAMFGEGGEFDAMAPAPKPKNYAELMSPVMERISEATYREDVPTIDEVFAHAGSQGMLRDPHNVMSTELLQALNSRKAAERRLTTRRATPEEEQAVARGRALGGLDPDVVAGEANKAGAVAGATARAGLAPDIISGQARLSGATAGASENARLSVQQQRGVGAYAPQTAENKPPTPEQKKAAGFFLRGTEAHNAVMGVEDQSTYGWKPNAIQSPSQRRFRQAEREFVSAYLRKESGAAITPDEEAMYGAMFFARPGDDGATIEQKRRARLNALDTLRYEGGRAVSELEGARGRTIDVLQAPVDPAQSAMDKLQQRGQRGRGAGPGGRR